MRCNRSGEPSSSKPAKKLFPPGNRKRLACIRHAFGKGGDSWGLWTCRLEQTLLKCQRDARCPSASRAKEISRFWWNTQPGVHPLAICGLESASRAAPPASSAPGAVRCRWTIKRPWSSVGISGGHDHPEVMSFLEHYLPRSNYRLGRKTKALRIHWFICGDGKGWGFNSAQEKEASYLNLSSNLSTKLEHPQTWGKAVTNPIALGKKILPCMHFLAVCSLQNRLHLPNKSHIYQLPTRRGMGTTSLLF